MDGVAAVGVYHNVHHLVSRYKVPLSCYQNTTPKYGKFELRAVRLAWGNQTVRIYLDAPSPPFGRFIGS